MNMFGLKNKKSEPLDETGKIYGAVCDFVEADLTPLIDAKQSARTNLQCFFKTEGAAAKNAADQTARKIAVKLKDRFSWREVKIYYDDLNLQEERPGRLAIHGLFAVGLPITVSALLLFSLDTPYTEFFVVIIVFFSALLVWLPFGIGKYIYRHRILKLACSLIETEEANRE